MKLLLKAESIIQRDALIAELKAQRIEVVSPKRDISRKFTDNTVDIAFEGYSAMFEGFDVFVLEKDFQRAQQVAQEFFKQLDTEPVHAKQPKERRYIYKFYFMSLVSTVIPIVFTLIALFNLKKALQEKEYIQPFYFLVSLALLAVGVYTSYLYAVEGLDKLNEFLQSQS